MKLKSIEPLMQQHCHNEIWVFSPDGELVLDVIDLDPTIDYQPYIDRNRMKLEHLKTLPHKVTALAPHIDNREEHDVKLQVGVRLGKGYWWHV